RRRNGDLAGAGGSARAACGRGVPAHQRSEVHRSGDSRTVEWVGRLGTFRGPHAALLTGPRPRLRRAHARAASVTSPLRGRILTGGQRRLPDAAGTFAIGPCTR